MYNVSKVKTIKGLYFQDIVDAKETPLEETLGSKGISYSLNLLK